MHDISEDNGMADKAYVQPPSSIVGRRVKYLHHASTVQCLQVFCSSCQTFPALFWPEYLNNHSKSYVPKIFYSHIFT